jgi:very-short-patch-repair endonuclease
MTRKQRSTLRESAAEATLVGQIRALGLPAPVRECRFHPDRKWRFDFAWPDQRLAVEVEGGAWVAGRHVRGRGFEADARKYLAAAAMGWTVLRVTPSMVRSGEAVAAVQRLLLRGGRR